MPGTPALQQKAENEMLPAPNFELKTEMLQFRIASLQLKTANLVFRTVNYGTEE